MKTIVGVKFKRTGKVYFFDPGYIQVKKDDKVIVETSFGEEFAEVTITNRVINPEKLKTPLKKIIRIASKEDIKHKDENTKIEREAFKVCQERIKRYKLGMDLKDVEYKFDNSKLLFYFTADGRIDFRELAKDLASVYRTRIELRQIGVRDEVKKIGGNGICGKELCCCSFLKNFETVSIKMAKEQNMSLNPTKISGNCGRLMCCLKYEEDVYEEKSKKLPKIGAIVKTEDGEGIVDSIETLKEIVRVKIKDGEDLLYKKYPVEEIKIIKNIEEVELEQDEYENLCELEKIEKLGRQDKINADEEI